MYLLNIYTLHTFSLVKGEGGSNANSAAPGTRINMSLR